MQGVTFRVGVAVGAGGEAGLAYIYDDPPSVYDTATYSGLDYYWVYLQNRVLTFETNRGRNNFDQVVPAGSMRVSLDDQDGKLNPDIGAELSDGQRLRPGTAITLEAQIEGEVEWVTLFVGIIETMNERYGPGGVNITMDIMANDIMAKWQRDAPPALENYILASQNVDDRIITILRDYAGWEEPRPIDQRSEINVALAATYFGSDWSDHINSAIQAAYGIFFISRDGTPTFENRKFRNGEVLFSIGAPGDDIQVIDTGGAKWDNARVRNDIQVTRVTNPANPTEPIPQRAENTQSQGYYGIRTRRVTSLAANDTQAANLAGYLLDDMQWDRIRINDLTLWAKTPQAWKQLFELDQGDKVLVTVRVGGLFGFSKTFEGVTNRISHQATATGDYFTALTVENHNRGNPFVGGPYSLAYSGAYNVDEED